MSSSGPLPADTAPVPSLEEPNAPPAADALMADAPPLASTATIPPRNSTPQRNGTAPSAPSVPPAAPAPPPDAAFPTKAAPHGARCRQYLNEKVTGVLLAGMKRVAAEQPDDPLRMLGEFLLAKSRELEGTGS